jgi:hypothetical protein
MAIRAKLSAPRLALFIACPIVTNQGFEQFSA